MQIRNEGPNYVGNFDSNTLTKLFRDGNLRPSSYKQLWKQQKSTPARMPLPKGYLETGLELIFELVIFLNRIGSELIHKIVWISHT